MSDLVLIVDDSEEDYEAVLRTLQKGRLKNPLFWCKSGHSALDYLKRAEQAQPGLILLDLNMPGIDGHKTLSIIKQDDTLKHIPVIILTTSGYAMDIKASYQSGADAYIQKPIRLEGLMDAVQKLNGFRLELEA